MHRIFSDDLDPSDLMVWVTVNGLRVMWFVAAALAVQWAFGHVRARIQNTWSIKT